MSDFHNTLEELLTAPNQPKGSLEVQLFESLGHCIVGVDEVGRGCLAGPVYSAAVVLNYDLLSKLPVEQKSLIRDSKQLSKTQRERIVPVIKSTAIYYQIASASPREIEKHGILGATFLSMRRALNKLPNIKMILVDGHLKIPRVNALQTALIGGDSKVFAIAAASILAKVARDRYMHSKAAKYHQWGFESHVGYGTKAHLEHIEAYGICPLHRKNFAPIRKFVENITT